MDAQLVGILRSVQLEIAQDAELLLCAHQDCGFTLSPNPAQVTRHLYERHSVPQEKRRQVTKLLKAGLQLRDPGSAQPRKDGVPRDPRLPSLDGFLCEGCGFWSMSKEAITRHVGREHSSTETRIRRAGPNPYTPVHLQSWVRNPRGSRYWTVTDDAVHPELLTAEPEPALARERVPQPRSSPAARERPRPCVYRATTMARADRLAANIREG